MSVQDLIKQEMQTIIDSVKESFKDVQSVAVAEAWKILQLVTATVIQLIEKFGNDLASPDKKQLAMQLISDFYDSVFKLIDLPVLPSAIESLLHTYIKKILMILVDSAIDAMVATFRDVGVFSPKIEAASAETITNNFLKNFNNIVRVK